MARRSAGCPCRFHKAGSRVVIYSRKGHDFTERFLSIAQVLHELPANAAVLDGEVVASDADGRPKFARLHVRWTRPSTIHLWAFDLLTFNGQDLRSHPLVKRQAVLQRLLERFGCPAISLSEPFEDGLALLRAAEERGLEGIVSKRRDAAYRSGECRDWRKVKTVAWRAANRERLRLFERDSQSGGLNQNALRTVSVSYSSLRRQSRARGELIHSGKDEMLRTSESTAFAYCNL
jgi:ATP-dependent DNA ligase